MREEPRGRRSGRARRTPHDFAYPNHDELAILARFLHRYGSEPADAPRDKAVVRFMDRTFAMFQKLPEPIDRCLDRALSAERRAALTSDDALRYDYERLARDWRQLASSYEFNESLERFIVAIEQMKEAAANSSDTPRARTKGDRG